MANSRSFKEYVAKTFGNQFWAVAEEYLYENYDSLDLQLYRIHKAGALEIADVHVEYVWVNDLPEMKIQFDVAISVTFEIPEADHHYDDSEEKKIWIMVRCRGDLDCNLQDFEIFDVSSYNGKNLVKNPMDDALVPVITKNNLDDVAEEFLRRHYPKALLEPTYLHSHELAKEMGLTIKMVHITKDGSIFGRSFFYDCETELYDPITDTMVKETISAGTILVDREAWFMSVIGATNNTIVHECVHWDKHKKAFALARLYDEQLSNVGCKVIGGVASNTRDAIDWMEWQANALAPKIQMPIRMFKKRVDFLISKFRREMNAYDMIDIVQSIIDQLVLDFGVSRTAAKIHLLDAGYEEAMGAFIFIDGKNVKPHKARKGYLERNKTFSISARDAAVMSVFTKEISKAKQKGNYLYIDSHYVLDHPRYVEFDEYGNLQLTHYARNHMDECCLVFELSVKNTYGQKYHTECFLNRDKLSSVDFSVAFHDGYENSPQESQLKLLAATMAEENKVFSMLPNDYTVALKTIIDWRNDQRKREQEAHPHKQIDKITAVELAERTGFNEATIRRTLNEGDSSTNTLILICLALHLPYKISNHIISHSPYPLRLSNTDHQWYDFVLQHHYPKTVKEVKNILAEYVASPL